MSDENEYPPELYARRPRRLTALLHRSWSTVAYAGMGSVACLAPTAIVDVPLWFINSIHPMELWTFLLPALFFPFIVNETAYQFRRSEDGGAMEALVKEAVDFDKALSGRPDLKKTEHRPTADMDDLKGIVAPKGFEKKAHPESSWMLETILDDPRPQFAQMRRETAIAVVQLARAYRKTMDSLGSAHTDKPKQIARQAFEALMKPRIAEYQATIAAMHETDLAKSTDIMADFERQAAALAAGHATPKAPARINTGSARVNRMVDTARRALEIDKDMVDDLGAPVRALIERHLPELLAKHSSASRHARLEDLPALDRELDEGIELVRKSVEEGISRLRSDKARDLHDEIAFLRLRRGGDDPLGLPKPSA